MLREQASEMLYKLKLHGMTQAMEQQIQQPEAASLTFEERLAMLVYAQWIWRENRATTTRLRQAKLKLPASMEDINYRHSRQLDRAKMKSLATCDWVRQHHNITMTGPSGIGKTYLCCALLEKACREGFTAYYGAGAKFFRQLAIAYADGSFDTLLSKLARINVLAIDDWGLNPLTDTERRHFLEVPDDRYESRSTILTSQFVVGAWHDLIGNPTLGDTNLERILSHHHEIALQGETMRPVKKAAASHDSEQPRSAGSRAASKEVKR